MAVDVKEVLAEAAVRLLLENKGNLTVKDIVDECNLSRQAFYYHFRDIPDLLRWYLEQDIEMLRKELDGSPVDEASLKRFMLLAISSEAYLKKTQNTKYAAEMQGIMRKLLSDLFIESARSNGFFSQLSQSDLDILVRYHSLAFIGLLEDWDDEDTKNLDHIVHMIYQIISGALSPFADK